MKRKRSGTGFPANPVALILTADNKSGREVKSKEADNSSDKRVRPKIDTPPWFVARLATKSEETRKKEEKPLFAGKAKQFECGKGLSYSALGKPAVENLLVTKSGVAVVTTGGALFGGDKRVLDYNHFRSKGFKTFKKVNF
jgi:hypothetical protein